MNKKIGDNRITVLLCLIVFLSVMLLSAGIDILEQNVVSGADRKLSFVSGCGTDAPVVSYVTENYEDDGTVVSFVDGMVTDESKLRDEMYETAALHNENGTWQMIFGVNTLPAYRRRGCAGAVLERVIADARAQGRRGCVLTCKDKLVHYYEKFGFVNEGVSQSTHGGVVWYDMRLTF